MVVSRGFQIAGCIVAALSLLWSAESFAYDPGSVKQFKSAVVREMCRDGGEWLRCYKQEPFNCVDISNEVVPNCVDDMLAKTPSLDRAKYVEWFSQDLHTCIKDQFMERYGALKVDSAECADQ